MNFADSQRNIKALNLSTIASDLVRQGWSPEAAESAVENYRLFLETIAAHPKAHLVPTRSVDEAWHAHMLRPAAYYADCMVCFGRIVDHEPGVYGTPAYEAAYQATRALVPYGDQMPMNPYAEGMMAGADCYREPELPDETPLGVAATALA
ncbi:hypothetical protein [Azospirillum sp. Sh1]|uniref:hypothetical protein n=1 Tax=Azospirillum sp. Sh1 TaxID=2607285 RepID=UPI0011ECF4FC|nr:hypothetical protein [Azospirillum sp. Sh1]KAA0576658.1 hypothetical protein FZ029_12385 [Azospirillum sp. Sh1]